jgi:protein KTI12
MPLVLLCGIPCSGKTRRAKELVEHFKTEGYENPVHLLHEELAGSKDACYSDSRQEKTLRAKLKSDTERYLTEDSIVILDSLNYIKGYRYELYCVSKHLRTPHCVLWCHTPAGMAKEWNAGTHPTHCYSDSVFDALLMRFEPPDSRNRWDYPLFVIYPDDPLPTSDICDALFHRKPPPPNKSTQSQPLSETSFLHELDRLTQEVVRSIMDAQRSPGEPVTLPGCKDRVELSRPVTMVELRRLRKQFISYTKHHPVSDYSNITTLFCQFLSKTI